jgi:hypothetical protein
VTNTTQSLEQAAEASGGRVVERLDAPQNRAVLLKFPTEQAAQAAAEGLAKRHDVQYVERNGIVEATAVSSDPHVGFQWHHTVIRKTTNLGTLPSAPPTIAVVDSGVDYNHRDLAGNIWTNPGEVAANGIDDDNNGYVDDVHGYDFVNGDGDPMDDLGHGTHVAGIAAATAGNGELGEGVSPNSKILAIKVLSSSDISTYFNVARGLAYAAPPTLLLRLRLSIRAYALTRPKSPSCSRMRWPPSRPQARSWLLLLATSTAAPRPTLAPRPTRSVLTRAQIPTLPSG